LRLKVSEEFKLRFAALDRALTAMGLSREGWRSCHCTRYAHDGACLRAPLSCVSEIACALSLRPDGRVVAAIPQVRKAESDEYVGVVSQSEVNARITADGATAIGGCKSFARDCSGMRPASRNRPFTQTHTRRSDGLALDWRVPASFLL